MKSDEWTRAFRSRSAQRTPKGKTPEMIFKEAIDLCHELLTALEECINYLKRSSPVRMESQSGDDNGKGKADLPSSLPQHLASGSDVTESNEEEEFVSEDENDPDEVIDLEKKSETCTTKGEAGIFPTGVAISPLKIKVDEEKGSEEGNDVEDYEEGDYNSSKETEDYAVGDALEDKDLDDL
ncbi:hypothetical protein U1Q18_003436 [Sarracenia purpurea var. burkii]